MFSTTLFIGGIGGTEMIIILVIALLLFGGRKIPELARDIGSGIKEFRRSMSSPLEEEQKTTQVEEPRQIEYQPGPTTKKATRKTSRKA